MYRFKQAFTLIELLVVMALMALSVSIILPLTIKQIDAARYRGERELSALFIQRMQHNSFFLSRPVTVNAGGKALVANSGNFTQRLDLQYIAFEEQHIEFLPLNTSVKLEFNASIGQTLWKLKIENQNAIWVNAD